MRQSPEPSYVGVSHISWSQIIQSCAQRLKRRPVVGPDRQTTSHQPAQPISVEIPVKLLVDFAPIRPDVLNLWVLRGHRR